MNIHTARPGIVIGRRGAQADELRKMITEITGNQKIQLNIVEIKHPDLDAQLVAEGIAEQLKKRTSFRRAMKMRCEATMASGAKGVRVLCSGRLGGAEMARRETQKQGSIPLQTLQANVDYGFAVAKTTYGTIGVKVWIYLGAFGEEIEPIAQDDTRGRGRGGRRGRR